MTPNITFLINSCDKYEDAWHPFFECLWHFAGELPYPMVLNTEKKQYSSPHYNIKCVNQIPSLHPTWSKRLLHVLEEVETEYIFFLLEDYFLKDVFDRDRLDKVVDYMESHPDVALVDVGPHWAATPEEAESNRREDGNIVDDFVERKKASFNITCTPGVWRVSAMKDILRPHEDVWDFEIYSGIRAKKLGWKVVRYVTRTPAIYQYDDQIWGSGMGITGGHWLPNNKPFFESLGIRGVNYDRLGIMEAASIEEVRKKNRSNPFVMLKKIPRKIRKRLTRKKSLQ